MIQIVTADGAAEQKIIGAMRARAAAANMDITRAVSAILEDVRVRGIEAVEEYSLRFDGTVPYEIPRETLEEAYAACPEPLIRAMEHAAANIRDYNEKLLVKSTEWTSPDGGTVGRVVRSGD